MQTQYDDKTGEMVIRFKVRGAELHPSASGKTLIVATTSGNKKVDCGAEGEIVLGLNAYRPR
ncbi:MAG: hypothetical protein HQ511_10605 [Rhodospirillales bacterium]|nr:hypothetical protein [Rhodospirillales bacterium]